MPITTFPKIFKLPPPRDQSSVSLESALRSRRSVRAYASGPLTVAHIAQLLWAAQGITGRGGSRTAPSAGALYPLEIYVAAGNVQALPPGIYKYLYHDHTLVQTAAEDKRAELSRAALHQSAIAKAPAVVIIGAIYERTTKKYGDRGIRYVYMEVGHAAQNVCLQAVALGLGTVVIGAFRDDEVKQLAHLPVAEQPLYLIPVGR
ncbi:MAG: SagB/ThcOx family dehydrogenase [Desulfobacterales bacterium]|nr:MAG: SagB/ThcOx family dehydrogenase [Desulfobacterales bacterium]